MRPSWSSRLLSGSSSSSAGPIPTSQSTTSPPTTVSSLVDGSSNSTAISRGDSSAGRRHIHNRSASHPLPRIFGRKKSSGTLEAALESSGIVDESLVPVDDTPPPVSPTRTGSGRRTGDEAVNATRHCMCCGCKVRFPQHLSVFRCTGCLTVNDLEIQDATASKDRTEGQTGASAERGQQVYLGPKPVLPISLDRSRAIIDKCLETYLDLNRGDQPVPKAAEQRGTSQEDELSGGFDNAKREETSNPSQDQTLPPPLPSSTATSAPSPEPPTPVFSPSATIKDFTDFDQFSFATGAPPAPSASSKPPSRDGKPLSSPSTRKPVPTRPPRVPLPPPPVEAQLTQRPTLNRNATPPDGIPRRSSGVLVLKNPDDLGRYDRVKKIFRPLEEYMYNTYGNHECLNASFSTARPKFPGRTHSESAIRTPPPEPMDGSNNPAPADFISQLDAKTLLVGDFAENGDWWTGRLERNSSDKRPPRRGKGSGKQSSVNWKSPLINWRELDDWYETVHGAGRTWRRKLDSLESSRPEESKGAYKDATAGEDVDADLLQGREHAARALLKITESLLKRPKRPLSTPEDLRFLLIILANPSLCPPPTAGRSVPGSARNDSGVAAEFSSRARRREAGITSPQKVLVRDTGQHAGILKRIFGLLAHSPDSSHMYLISWFSRLPEVRFAELVDLVASFVTYRLSKKRTRPRSVVLTDGGLIPDLSGSARNTSAQLQSATGLSGGTVKANDNIQSVADYGDDWQLKAAAKTMALLFAANNTWQSKDAEHLISSAVELPALRPRAKTHGQLLPTSDFYNTLLDYHDLIADFKAWESKKAKFAFCQYPFFLSMGSKIKILEYDARRQMENKAREAYFDQVISRRNIDAYLHLRVRRDCMVEDSLRQISEAVGSGHEDLKKGLRIHFAGEEGVDAGGLRKEWFLMLVRDIFDPNHGMFLYDEEARTCYFNPNAFETSDQYYLVGALLGLAIYNSTILDVALPPFAFRKLLASAPASASNPALPVTGTRGVMTYTIDDLAEFRPSLAAGLRQLLEYEGDVQATFCRDFVASIERYGSVTEIPLCPGGEKKPVTNENRQEFVDLYVRYLLDIAVTRQFEPFKRGFFTVCAGNALSLFRPEEIELLIRGSDEALDVDSLKAVAVYENWKNASSNALIPDPAETVPVIRWFWDFFSSSDSSVQRKILGFITGSDRIPAVGATNLVLRIVAGGDGTGREEEAGGIAVERFPIARTCFNMIVLWRYGSRQKLEEKLWRAISESEGFGLK